MRASAESGSLFWSHQVRLVSTVEMLADPVGQLGGRQQPSRLDNRTLAVQPLGLDRVEPWALARQVAHQDAHTPARPFDLTVVLPDPGAHELADMPGGIVPNQG